MLGPFLGRGAPPGPNPQPPPRLEPHRRGPACLPRESILQTVNLALGLLAGGLAGTAEGPARWPPWPWAHWPPAGGCRIGVAGRAGPSRQVRSPPGADSTRLGCTRVTGVANLRWFFPGEPRLPFVVSVWEVPRDEDPVIPKL